jgi:hypothetical protein
MSIKKSNPKPDRLAKLGVKPVDERARLANCYALRASDPLVHQFVDPRTL